MDNITLLIASSADAEALLELYAPYVRETAITFEYEVPSPEEFQSRIRRTLEKYPYLIAEREGRCVGYAYAGAFHARAAYDWAVETSVYVERGLRRQGVGQRLYTALEEILTLQNILNLNACIAYPAEEDPYLTRDSADFHQRLSYQLVGRFHQCGYKFGRWYDMIWMEKMLGAHRSPQPPVRPFPEIREAAEALLNR